jgi:hypothetical protein
MKTTLLALFLSLGLAIPARAQEADQLHLKSPRLEHAKVRKAVGAAFMIAGITNFVLSAGFGIGQLACDRGGECGEVPVWMIVSMGEAGVGAVLSGIGIPLYVSGANDLARAQSVRVSLDGPTRLSVRF